jgi:hypothetical protein
MLLYIGNVIIVMFGNEVETARKHEKPNVWKGCNLSIAFYNSVIRCIGRDETKQKKHRIQ